MITTEDGGIHLLLNAEHPWTREESLAHINPGQILFLDLPVPEPKLRLNVSASDVLSAYLTRVKTHIKQLRDLPSGLSRFAKHFATGRYEEIELGSVNRDAFGLRKFIVLASGMGKGGKVVVIDSANQGRVVWSKFFGRRARVQGMWILRESSAVRGQPPLIGVLLVDGAGCRFLQINGLDGTVVNEDVCQLGFGDVVMAFAAPLGVLDEEGRRPVVVIPKVGPAKIFPESGTSKTILERFGDKIYYSLQEDGIIQGFHLDISVILTFSLLTVDFRKHTYLAFQSTTRQSAPLGIISFSRRKGCIHRTSPRRSICAL